MNKGKGAEIITLPVRLGLEPIRQLGQAARRLTSSQELAERRMQEHQQSTRSRQVFETIAMGQALRGSLQHPAVWNDAEQRSQLQGRLDATAKQLGYLILDAAADEPEIPLQTSVPLHPAHYMED